MIFTSKAQIDAKFGAIGTASDGSTVTFNLDTNDKWIVTLGGNRTLALSGGSDGQPFAIMLQQDGTGSRTVTWWANIKWAYGIVPVLTTSASKYDTFIFLRLNSSEYHGFIVGQNI